MKQYQQKKMIILCGNTGAGKSSIYNWILGANFQMIEKNGIDYLYPDIMKKFILLKWGQIQIQLLKHQFIYMITDEIMFMLIFESILGEYHKLLIDLFIKQYQHMQQKQFMFQIVQNQNCKIEVRILHNSQNNKLDPIFITYLTFFLLLINTIKMEQMMNKFKELKFSQKKQKKLREECLKIDIICQIKSKEMIQKIFAHQARQNLVKTLTNRNYNNVTQLCSKIDKWQCCKLLDKGTHCFQKSKQMSQQIKKMIDIKQTFQISPEQLKSSNSIPNIPQAIKGLQELQTLMIEDKTSNIAEEDEFQNFKKIYDYFLPYENTQIAIVFINIIILLMRCIIHYKVSITMRAYTNVFQLRINLSVRVQGISTYLKMTFCIGKSPKVQIPEGQFAINTDTRIWWQYSKNKLKSITFQVRSHSYEYFGSNEQLREIRLKFALYVFQMKIQDEYQAESVLGKSSHVRVLELTNLYNNQQYAAKCTQLMQEIETMLMKNISKQENRRFKVIQK